MTIDPAVLIGAIGALGGLLVFIVRLFLTGALLARNVVTREDYDALKAVNATLVASIPALTDAVNKALATAEIARKNGNGAK